MNNKIILKDGKQIIGVGGIVVSELDNSIFINNSFQIEEGVSGSLAFYCQDGVSVLHSTGESCTWDQYGLTLTSKYIKVDQTLTSTNIKVDDVIKLNQFEFKVRSNDKTDLFFRNSLRDTLIINYIHQNDKNGYRSETPLAIDSNRIYLNCTTNIKSKTVTSAIGENTDLKGDIVFDENFIYCCIRDYDGISKIWKRSDLTEW